MWPKFWLAISDLKFSVIGGAEDQFAAHGSINAGVGSAARHVVRRKDRQETGQNQPGMGPKNLFAFSHVCHPYFHLDSRQDSPTTRINTDSAAA